MGGKKKKRYRVWKGFRSIGIETNGRQEYGNGNSGSRKEAGKCLDICQLLQG
jgi:hypothetical protein